MKRLWHYNGLSITLIFLFFLFWSGQTLTGWRDHNNDQQIKHQPTETLLQYIESGDFAEATFENWESEFLQMGAYVLLTTFLFQKGSAESKDPDEEKFDEEGKVPLHGWRLILYENSLSLAFFALFLFAFLLHAWGGSRAYSQELIEEGKTAVGFWTFITSARFWFQSFQNWQSEFLAVASVVLLSIFLRQKGSPESKSLTSPNSATGE
jgi:hypothetical protein